MKVKLLKKIRKSYIIKLYEAGKYYSDLRDSPRENNVYELTIPSYFDGRPMVYAYFNTEEEAKECTKRLLWDNYYEYSIKYWKNLNKGKEIRL